MALDGNPDTTNGYNSVAINGALSNVNFIKSMVCPIGSIVSWLKTFTNTPSLPDGWVECDGATLSDSDSPYNGQVIPDLNGGNRFLRGNATSGGTGGSETASHTHDLPMGAGAGNELQIEANWSDGRLFTAESKVTDMSSSSETSLTTFRSDATAPNNKPPYYEVVWIMRIK